MSQLLLTPYTGTSFNPTKLATITVSAYNKEVTIDFWSLANKSWAIASGRPLTGVNPFA